MDTDLFQILTLILLLGLLLTLFGVLQSLGAIRRALEGGSSNAVAAPAAAEAPVAAAEPESQPEPDSQPETRHSTWSAGDEPQPVEAVTEPAPEPARELTPEPEPEPVRTGWPAPQEASSPAEEDPFRTAPAASAGDSGATGGTGARVLYGDSGLTSATPNDAALQPSHREPEPEPDPAASTAAAEDPQEQPFERDGRWWFRRGDELLVYEEQTGQWIAAGEPSTSGSVASAGGDQASAPAETGSPEGQVTTQQEAVGSFWKCPSCGAVNGSTATSCRMCFTARP